MLDQFIYLLKRANNNLHKLRAKYIAGYTHILKANEEVNRMEEHLRELVPMLEKRVLETEELTKELEHDTETANLEKEKLEYKEKEVSAVTEQYKNLKDDAETNLKVALIELEEATRALKQLNINDIYEIRTFINPPQLIVYTLEAIALLLEIPQTWDSIRKMLLNNFLDRLQNFPRDSIKPSIVARLKKKMIENPSFNPEQVGLQNIASKSLCKWILSLIHI